MLKMYRLSLLRKVVSSHSYFFSSRRRHTRCGRDWSSDVCSSDLRDADVTGVQTCALPIDGPAATTKRPAVRWQHVATPLHVLDYGPLFNGLDETGVITTEPPTEGKDAYG